MRSARRPHVVGRISTIPEHVGRFRLVRVATANHRQPQARIATGVSATVHDHVLQRTCDLWAGGGVAAFVVAAPGGGLVASSPVVTSGGPWRGRAGSAVSAAVSRRSSPMVMAIMSVVAGVDGVGLLVGEGDDEDGQGEHREQDESVPGGPAAALVVVQADVGFRGLEGFLDASSDGRRPGSGWRSGRGEESSSGRTPGRRCRRAADEQAVHAGVVAGVVVDEGPVVEAFAFGAGAAGTAFPGQIVEAGGDVVRA